MNPITITLYPQPPAPWPRLGQHVAFKLPGSNAVIVGYFGPRMDRVTDEYPHGETFNGNDNTRVAPADIEWWSPWEVTV